MRHRVKGRSLSRTSSHRTATLRALATSLLKNKKIKTTTAKAKELRSFVEPLITKAKKGSVHARRYVARHIHDKAVINELFHEIVEKIGERAGGYTRVIKLGNRIGDAAEMSLIELVDYNDLVAKKPKKSKPKSTAKKAEPEVEEAEVIEETTETKKESEDKKAKKTTAKKKSTAKDKEESDKAEEVEEKKTETKKKPAAKKATAKKDSASKSKSSSKTSTKAKSSAKKSSASKKKGS